MFRNLFLGFVALVASLFLAGNVMAATGQNDTVEMTVDVEAIVACSLSAVPLLNFNTFNGADDADVATTIQVTCNSNAPYTVKLDAGENQGGGPNCGTLIVRCLKHTTATAPEVFLKYTIFPDTTTSPNLFNTNCISTTEWDSTSCFGEANGDPGQSQTFGFLATVPAQTIGKIGAYADIVDVSLDF